MFSFSLSESFIILMIGFCSDELSFINFIFDLSSLINGFNLENDYRSVVTTCSDIITDGIGYLIIESQTDVFSSSS